jgi:hypothetical protein
MEELTCAQRQTDEEDGCVSPLGSCCYGSVCVNDIRESECDPTLGHYWSGLLCSERNYDNDPTYSSCISEVGSCCQGEPATLAKAVAQGEETLFNAYYTNGQYCANDVPIENCRDITGNGIASHAIDTSCDTRTGELDGTGTFRICGEPVGSCCSSVVDGAGNPIDGQFYCDDGSNGEGVKESVCGGRPDSTFALYEFQQAGDHRNGGLSDSNNCQNRSDATTPGRCANEPDPKLGGSYCCLTYDSSLIDTLQASIDFIDTRYEGINHLLCFAGYNPCWDVDDAYDTITNPDSDGGCLCGECYGWINESGYVPGEGTEGGEGSEFILGGTCPDLDPSDAGYYEEYEGVCCEGNCEAENPGDECPCTSTGTSVQLCKSSCQQSGGTWCQCMPEDYGNALVGQGRSPSNNEAYGRGLDQGGGSDYGFGYCCGTAQGNCYNWLSVTDDYTQTRADIRNGELCVSCCHYAETDGNNPGGICDFGPGGENNVTEENCGLALSRSNFLANLSLNNGGQTPAGLPGCNNYYRPNNRPPIDDPTDLRFVPNDDGNGNAAYPPDDATGVPGGGLIGNCSDETPDTNPHYCGACKYKVIQKEKLSSENGGIFDCENFVDENGIPNPNACLPTSSPFLPDIPTVGDDDALADNNNGHANFALQSFHTRQANKLENCCQSRDAIKSIGTTNENLKTFFPGVIYDNRPDEVNLDGFASAFNGAGFYQNPFKDDSPSISTVDICEYLEALSIPGYGCDEKGNPPDDFDIEFFFENEQEIGEVIVTCSSNTSSGVGIDTRSEDGSNIIGVDYLFSEIFETPFRAFGSVNDLSCTLTEKPLGHGGPDCPAGRLETTPSGGSSFCEPLNDPSCGFTMRRNVNGCFENGGCPDVPPGGDYADDNRTNFVQYGFAFRKCENCDFNLPCYAEGEGPDTSCKATGKETAVCVGDFCEVNGAYYVDYDPQFPAGDPQNRGAGCYIPYSDGSDTNWKYYALGEQLPGCCGINGQINKDPEEPEPDDGCDKIINPACDYNSADCGKCTDGPCDDNPQCSEYDYFDTNEGISVAEENCRWNPQGTLMWSNTKMVFTAFKPRRHMSTIMIGAAVM